jgi:hypothetical protein
MALAFIGQHGLAVVFTASLRDIGVVLLFGVSVPFLSKADDSS